MSAFIVYRPAALGGGGSGGSGIASINADTTAAQTLTVGTSGTDFAIVDAGSGSHVFNLPTASASNRGALSAADWSTFNGKQAAGSYITSLTTDVVAAGPGAAVATIQAGVVTNAKLADMATNTFKGRTTAGTGVPQDLSISQAKSMLSLTGTNSGDVTIGTASGLSIVGQALSLGLASAGVTGALSGTDWSTFNNKQPAGTYVTSLTVTTGNGVSGSFTAGATPALSLTLGAITPSSVAASGTVTGSNLSGTNTGDQTISLTGDVSGSGTSSFAATIAANAVTLAKMAQVATQTFLGRTTASTGNVEALTVAQAKTMLSLTGTNSGDVTLAGETYLSIAGQVITAAAVNLSGTQATGTLAAARMPALTGDVTTSAGAVATTVAKIQSTTVSGTTGTGNVAFSASPLFTGTVSSGAVLHADVVSSAGASAFGATQAGNAAYGFALSNTANNSAGGGFASYKTRAVTGAASTAVQSGDELCVIYGHGANGTNYQPAARLQMLVDGTVSGSAMPGKFVFSTTPAGSNTLATVMTLDSAGQLGLGTAPSYPLHVSAATGVARLVSSTGTNIVYYHAGNTSGACILGNEGSVAGTITNGSTAYAAVLGGTQAKDTQIIANNTVRMNITSAGSFNIGVGAPDVNHYIQNTSTTNNVVSIINASTSSSADATGCVVMQKGSTTNTTSQVFTYFSINAGATGSGKITANGANSAAFGTYSDARLKDNIVNLPGQLANILALRPVEFDYKDGSGHQIGFIAQEMQTVYPDTVNADNDGMLSISGWDKTTSRLVKAFQELHAEKTALEARIADSEDRLAALLSRIEALESKE